MGSDRLPTRHSPSEFLLYVTVLSSARGAQNQCYAHGVTAGKLVDTISGYERFPLPPLTCPSMDDRIYVGSDTLLLVSESVRGDGRSSSEYFDISMASTATMYIDDVIAKYPDMSWRIYSGVTPQEFSSDDLPGFLRWGSS
ncbi:hypothetical protein GCM10022416_01410 [Actinomadura keratinilytica]|uniref:Uncharacterized protein n=1 Tax=Actinomadura keratinilytica TaxID=547461 RepID=A0ABP7XWP5_9ACTN